MKKKYFLVLIPIFFILIVSILNILPKVRENILNSVSEFNVNHKEFTEEINRYYFINNKRHEYIKKGQFKSNEMIEESYPLDSYQWDLYKLYPEREENTNLNLISEINKFDELNYMIEMRDSLAETIQETEEIIKNIENEKNLFKKLGNNEVVKECEEKIKSLKATLKELKKNYKEWNKNIEKYTKKMNKKN